MIYSFKPARLKLIGITLVALAIGACASLPQPSALRDLRGVELERDLAGRSYAIGIFRGKFGAPTRRFNVVLDGTRKGNTLTLKEVFAFDDGEQDIKTWIFEKTGPGRYRGTREDVIDEAVVTEENGIIQLAYEAEIGKNRTRVRFEDIIERRSDGVIINRAIVSKFGLEIGNVELVFSRDRKIFDELPALK